MRISNLNQIKKGHAYYDVAFDLNLLTQSPDLTCKSVINVKNTYIESAKDFEGAEPVIRFHVLDTSLIEEFNCYGQITIERHYSEFYFNVDIESEYSFDGLFTNRKQAEEYIARILRGEFTDKEKETLANMKRIKHLSDDMAVEDFEDEHEWDM